MKIEKLLMIGLLSTFGTVGCEKDEKVRDNPAQAAEIEKLKKDKEQLKSDLGSQVTTLVSAREQLAAAKESNNILSAENATLTQDLKLYEEGLKDLLSLLNGTQTEREKANIVARITVAKAAVTLLKEEKIKLESLLAQSAAQIKDLETKVTGLTNDLVATNQKLKDGEAKFEESQARIAQIEVDLKSEQSKVQALESKKAELEAALANAGTEKAQLEKELAAVRDDLVKTTADYQQTLIERDEARAQLLTITAERDQLQSDVTVQADKLVSMTTELASVSEQLQNSQVKVQNYTSLCQYIFSKKADIAGILAALDQDLKDNALGQEQIRAEISALVTKLGQADADLVLAKEQQTQAEKGALDQAEILKAKSPEELTAAERDLLTSIQEWETAKTASENASLAVSSSQALIAQARTDGTALVLKKGEIDSEINRLEGQILTIVDAAEKLKAEEALAAAKKEAVGLQEAIDELKVTIDAESKRLHETLIPNEIEALRTLQDAAAKLPLANSGNIAEKAAKVSQVQDLITLTQTQKLDLDDKLTALSVAGERLQSIKVFLGSLESQPGASDR